MRRSIGISLLTLVALVALWIWYAGISPQVVLLEIFRPVTPGLNLAVTVSNDTSQSTPALVLSGPAGVARIAPILPGKSTTVELVDARYGDVAVIDEGTGKSYPLLDKNPNCSGVSGLMTVYWGDKLTPTAVASVFAGPLRYSPRQWYADEGVWPLAPQD